MPANDRSGLIRRLKG